MDSWTAEPVARLPWRVLAVASIFLTIALISAGMMVAAVGIQSTVRAGALASGFWTASLHEAAQALSRYALHGDPEDLVIYEREMAVPQAAWQAARLLDGARPVAAAGGAAAGGPASAGPGAAGRALIRAGSHPEDVAGMMALYRCCRQVVDLAGLATAWQAGLAALVELEALGAAVKAADPDADGTQRRIIALETEARRIQRAARTAVDAVAIDIRDDLRRVNLTVVLLLLILGAWATLRIVRGQRDSDHQLRTLLDSAGDGFVVVDPDSGGVLMANRAAELMLGIPVRELTGRAYASLFVGVAPAAAASGEMRLAVLRGPFDTQLDVEVNCGATRWAGRPVILAIIRDIGARLLAEQERRIATNAMANISEAIVITDERLRVVTVNRAFTTITGYGADDVLGRLPRWLRFDGGTARRRELLRTLLRDGRWQGELPGVRRDGTRFPQRISVAAVRDPLGRVTHYVALFSDHSAARDRETRLRHQASHDTLTALPNRAALEERAARALRLAQADGSRLALLFIDLDGFKGINDTYGHAAGDEVLRVMGHRIRSVLRAGDFVARVGGDEFNLLLEDVDAEADVARVARLLLELACEPIEVRGHAVTLSSSIGISFYPRDARDFDGLAACADLAMYEAKSRGRNNVQIYSERLASATRQRATLIAALRDADPDSQLSLHYQPIRELTTGRIAGLQALLRWTHPELGAVAPRRFVPLAEEAGVIDRFSLWAVQQACARAAAWRAAGLGERGVSVKLSARCLRDPDLAQRIARAAAAAQWPVDRLTLEISEATLGHPPQVVRQALEQLAALGVRIAVDGFGAGQAALGHLRGLPLSVLKIDRDFIAGLPDDPESIALIRGLIVLANGLGVVVVGEGIESPAQRDALLAEGCGLGIGYLYGRPMTADAIERLLRDERADEGASAAGEPVSTGAA